MKEAGGKTVRYQTRQVAAARRREGDELDERRQKEETGISRQRRKIWGKSQTYSVEGATSGGEATGKCQTGVLRQQRRPWSVSHRGIQEEFVNTRKMREQGQAAVCRLPQRKSLPA
eukprot:756319-Hanusia_phi.AAC.5